METTLSILVMTNLLLILLLLVGCNNNEYCNDHTACNFVLDGAFAQGSIANNSIVNRKMFFHTILFTKFWEIFQVFRYLQIQFYLIWDL